MKHFIFVPIVVVTGSLGLGDGNLYSILQQ